MMILVGGGGQREGEAGVGEFDSTVAPSKSTSCFEEDESCLRVMVASFESDR
jgi:hypothetical protein